MGILLTTVSTLAQYDIPQSILSVLERSVRHVSIIGRRRPLEVAFTMKKLRELMNLPAALILLFCFKPPTDDGRSVPLTRKQSRTFQLLNKGSRNAFGSPPKTLSLELYRSPSGLMIPSPPPLLLHAHSSSTQELALSLVHTTLDDQTHHAIPAGETTTFSTSLVVTSRIPRGT